MIKKHNKTVFLGGVLIASSIVFISAERASAVAPVPPASASACIEFDPGASTPTNDGQATLNQVIKLFDSPRSPTSVFVNVQYLSGDEVQNRSFAFKKNVPGWLDLAHSRTKNVIDRILTSTDTIFTINENVQPGGRGCPMVLIVRLQGSAPSLQCDTTSCHESPN